MSCKQVQQQILERLAAGESLLAVELVAHLQSCPACRDYDQVQRWLFRSIDQGLGVIANSTVPPSLLPAVRARLDEQATIRTTRLFGWPLAALGAATLLVVTLLFFLHRPSRPSRSAPEVARIATPEPSPRPHNASPVSVDVAKPTRKRLHRNEKTHAPLPNAEPLAEPALEVIVLPEEREALAKFIAQVPDRPAALLALTRPVLQGNQSAVEIALLTIKPLEVKPLEPSPE